MTSYLLRSIPPDLWHKVKVRAAIDGVTVRQAILGLLADWVETQSVTRTGDRNG